MSDSYQLHILAGSRRLDPHRDNVDVEIELADGSRFAATFFTPENVRALLRPRANVEDPPTTFFWAKHAVFVERLTEDSIKRAIDELIARGELDQAFERL